MLFVLATAFQAHAQTRDWQLLRNMVVQNTHNDSAGTREVSVFKTMKVARRPYLAVPAALMYTYRHVISEQMGTECTYDLSCSRFSTKAIGEQGIVKGIWLTTDRLTRCNQRAFMETNPIWHNSQSGKLIDEPQMYR